MGGHLAHPPLLFAFALPGCSLVFVAFFLLLGRVDPVQQLCGLEVYGFDCCLKVLSINSKSQEGRVQVLEDAARYSYD